MILAISDQKFYTHFKFLLDLVAETKAQFATGASFADHLKLLMAKMRLKVRDMYSLILRGQLCVHYCEVDLLNNTVGRLVQMECVASVGALNSLKQIQKCPNTGSFSLQVLSLLCSMVLGALMYMWTCLVHMFISLHTAWILLKVWSRDPHWCCFGRHEGQASRGMFASAATDTSVRVRTAYMPWNCSQRDLHMQ